MQIFSSSEKIVKTISCFNKYEVKVILKVASV